MREKIWKFVVLLGTILLLVLGPVRGQQYILKNFGLAEGLPSRVIYDVAIDRDGLLWIAAEGGLLTYDGSQFLNDPIPQLANTEVLKLDLMLDGSLLCLDLNGRLRNIQGMEVVDLLPGEVATNFNGVIAKENTRGEIMILMGRKYWIFSEKNIAHRKLIRKDSLSQTYLPNGLDLINDTTFVLNTQGEILLIDNFKSKKYTKPKELIFINSFASLWNGKLVFNANNKLFELDPISLTILPILTEISEQVNEDILNFCQIGEQLWIDTRNSVYQANKQDDQWVTRQILKDIIPGKIIKDWQGNIWITSVTDGLFFIPDQAELVQPIFMDYSIDRVATDTKGNIFTYTGESTLQKYDSGLKMQYSRQVEDVIYKSYFLEYDELTDRIFLGTNTTAAYTSDLKRRKQYSNGSSSKSISFNHLGEIFMTDATGGVIYSADGGERVFFKRAYSHLVYDDKLIYFGSIDGLFKYEKGQESIKVLPAFDMDIRCLAKDKYNRIWIGTQGHGIYIWDKSNDELIEIGKKEGLLDNRCKKILMDGDHAWVASAKGISKINIDQPEDILTLTNEIGLPEGGINDFVQRIKDLVVATEDGLLLIDKRIGEKKDSLRLNYLSIEFNGKLDLVRDSIFLEKENRNLKINFQGIDFKNRSSINYQYKLDGIDPDWRVTKNNSIQYSSLPAGSFKFYLKANSPNCNEVILRTISIEVPKKFQETIWYSIVIFLLGCAVVGSLIWYFFTNYKDRNLFEKQINEARLSAIRSKMNPHFVFNAINSIQDFVMNNNKRDANRYLVQFSRLMRNVLNASTKQFISLEEELNTLELYLSLEKLRFDNELETNLEVDYRIKKSDVLLPPMLLQPHVENALKHGLMHKLGTGHLKIRIFYEQDYLRFEIEDDGVGRKSAAKYTNQRRMEDHVSQGTQLVKDQISLVNKITGKVNTVEVIDLYNGDEAVGTKVIIKFYESTFKASLEKAGHLSKG